MALDTRGTCPNDEIVRSPCMPQYPSKERERKKTHNDKLQGEKATADDFRHIQAMAPKYRLVWCVYPNDFPIFHFSSWISKKKLKLCAEMQTSNTDKYPKSRNEGNICTQPDVDRILYGFIRNINSNGFDASVCNSVDRSIVNTHTHNVCMPQLHLIISMRYQFETDFRNQCVNDLVRLLSFWTRL